MKTPKELEQASHDWVVNNLVDKPTCIAAYLRNPPQYEPNPRVAYVAGYQAACEDRFENNIKATYNEHKLVEANKTIEKLKERLKLLSVELSHFIGMANDVQSIVDGWKKDDQIFEHHDKVGPWAGFFPVKKND